MDCDSVEVDERSEKRFVLGSSRTRMVIQAESADHKPGGTRHRQKVIVTLPLLVLWMREVSGYGNGKRETASAVSPSGYLDYALLARLREKRSAPQSSNPSPPWPAENPRR